MNFIDKKAQEIVDHFFACGARVGKKDYDFARTTLQDHTAEILKEIDGMTLDPIGDGLVIEEVARKFGVPVSVAANQILEAEKEKVINIIKGQEEDKS